MLKKNIFTSYLANIYLAVLSFLFIPIYLEKLGAEAYGLVGIFAILQSIFFLFDSAFNTTLNREISVLNTTDASENKIKQLIKTFGFIYTLFSIIVCFVALILIYTFSHYWIKNVELDMSLIKLCLTFMALAIPFQLMISFYSGGLMGFQRHFQINNIKVLIGTIRTFGALYVVYYLQETVLYFFMWNLIVYAIHFIIIKHSLFSILRTSKSVRVEYDWIYFKKLRNYTTGIILISVTVLFLNQIDKIILSKVLGLHQFGLYTIIITLGSLLLQLSGPVTQPFFSFFSSLDIIKDRKIILDKYHQGSELISMICSPLALVLFFFSYELVFYWTHDITVTNEIYLGTAIYSLGTLFNVYLTMPYIYSIAKGWTNYTLFQNIILTIIMVPLTYFLSISYGINGGAVSWLLLNMVCFFISPIIIHRKLLGNITKNWYVFDITRPFIISFIILSLLRLSFDTFTFGKSTQILLIGLFLILTFIFLFSFSKFNNISKLIKN